MARSLPPDRVRPPPTPSRRARRLSDAHRHPRPAPGRGRRREAPKGELGFYVVSDGGPNPYRYHVRAPSFINLTPLAEMIRGHKIADAIAIFGTVDINMGECYR